MSDSNLKKTTISLFLILVIPVIGFSKEETVNSVWSDTTVSIDGSAEDWPAEYFHHEKKYMVYCAFKNDEQNLYILFKFTDPSYLSSIEKTGMTVWLNPDGKKKKNYGITFLKRRLESDVFLSLYEQQRGTVTEAEKQQILSKPFHQINHVNVINKKSKDPQQTGIEEPKAIFRANRTKEETVYEFIIPLERSSDFAAGIGTEPGKRLKIGFEWGGMTAEMKAELMRRRSEQASDAAAGSIEGGRSRMNTSSSFMNSRSGPKEYTYWLDVLLANPGASQ